MVGCGVENVDRSPGGFFGFHTFPCVSSPMGGGADVAMRLFGGAPTAVCGTPFPCAAALAVGTVSASWMQAPTGDSPACTWFAMAPWLSGFTPPALGGLKALGGGAEVLRLLSGDWVCWIAI